MKGRFVESPLGLLPCIGTMNPTVRIYVTIATIICSTQPRFMESPHDFDAVHWDHEPIRIPLHLSFGHPLPQWGRGMG